MPARLRDPCFPYEPHLRADIGEVVGVFMVYGAPSARNVPVGRRAVRHVLDLRVDQRRNPLRLYVKGIVVVIILRDHDGSPALDPHGAECAGVDLDDVAETGEIFRHEMLGFVPFLLAVHFNHTSFVRFYLHRAALAMNASIPGRMAHRDTPQQQPSSPLTYRKGAQ